MAEKKYPGAKREGEGCNDKHPQTASSQKNHSSHEDNKSNGTSTHDDFLKRKMKRKTIIPRYGQ